MSILEDLNSLTREISSSYESRIKGVSQIREGVTHIRRETQAQLQELDWARETLARQQRQGLAKVCADLNQAESRRKSGVYTWMGEVASARQTKLKESRADLSKRHADLRSSVSAQLQELDRTHNAMAQQQREDLERGPAELIRVDRLRKSEVKTWIEDVAASHGGARGVWRDLVAAMGATRAGTVAVAEAPVQVASPRPVARGVAPAIATEQDPVEGVVVGEVTAEFASLTERVFVYLANHPDGTRLAELEREIGLSRFQAARAVRHLIDEGKAEKRDFRYFAI